MWAPSNRGVCCVQGGGGGLPQGTSSWGTISFCSLVSKFSPRNFPRSLGPSPPFVHPPCPSTLQDHEKAPVQDFSQKGAQWRESQFHWPKFHITDCPQGANEQNFQQFAMFNILGSLYTKLYNQRIMADQQGLRPVTAIPRMEQSGHRIKLGGEPPCIKKGTKGLGVLRFPASDGPAPKWEVLSPGDAPPSPRLMVWPGPASRWGRASRCPRGSFAGTHRGKFGLQEVCAGMHWKGGRYPSSSTFRPTEGQNAQWREANGRRQRQTTEYRGLVPTPPPPSRARSLCTATVSLTAGSSFVTDSCNRQ